MNYRMWIFVELPGELEDSTLGIWAAGHNEHILERESQQNNQYDIVNPSKVWGKSVSSSFQEFGQLLQTPTMAGKCSM